METTIKSITQAAITPTEARIFQKAYNTFNRELFNNSLLKGVLITLRARGKTLGFVSYERFTERAKKATAHEIALNPEKFDGRTDEEILSTLVHLQVHLWQHLYGKPSRPGYCNKQWAEKMKEVGLQPSEMGGPGGKEIGQNVSYYILSDGAYAKAYTKLQAQGFRLNWQSRPKIKPDNNRTKYTCGRCGLNMWGKPDVLLLCGECYRDTGKLYKMPARKAK